MTFLWIYLADVLRNERSLSQSSYPQVCNTPSCNIASRLVSQLRRLDLDILIVPHHEEVDTLIALHAARHADIKVRVLEMPNSGNGNQLRMCAAANVVVFPSCFAAYHDLSSECRSSGTSIVVIPPIGLDITVDTESSRHFRDTFTVVYVISPCVMFVTFVMFELRYVRVVLRSSVAHLYHEENHDL